MIVLDKNTRRFSVVESQEEFSKIKLGMPGYISSGFIGGLANAGVKEYKKQQSIKQAVAKGEDKTEATKRAIETYGGIKGNFKTGMKAGLVTRFAAGRLRDAKNEIFKVEPKQGPKIANNRSKQKKYSVGGIGAVGLSGYTAIKRKQYVDRAIAEGKDPKQSRKEAKQIYGGITKNATKGYLAGKGVEYLDKQLGVSRYIKNTNTVKKINKLMKKI